MQYPLLLLFLNVLLYIVMPSKAALFNSKCDLIFDFGITHRNTALYNKYGNDDDNTV